MSRNPIETILGAVVLLVAGAFLAFAYNMADVKAVEGYSLKASFTKVGGLTPGGDVRISGIKVGTVVGMELDSDNFNAVISMTILPHLKLPVDTVASVTSEGLLGGKYVKLEPGHSKDVIASGGVIKNTKDNKALEELVGEIIFLATEDPGKPGH